MNDTEKTTLERIYEQSRSKNIRITQHAQEEMVEENIKLQELYEAISGAQILENYPVHRRGACCLISGFTKGKRPLHIVCTTMHPVLIVITVYEPKLPDWEMPTQRRQKSEM